MEENKSQNDEQPGIEPSEKNTESVCGPGCDCSKPKPGNKIRIIAGGVVLLLAASLFAYKLARPRVEAKAVDSPAYSAPEAVSGQVKQEAVAKAVQSARTQVGESLDSFGSLNTVAMDKDAVLILVKANDNETVKKETEIAISGAMLALKNKGVKAGLYTLRTDAPEYRNITSQVSAPAVLVACKGRGMNTVSGDISETKLLQAFVAASSGGCGTSCAPGSTCK